MNLNIKRAVLAMAALEEAGILPLIVVDHHEPPFALLGDGIWQATAPPLLLATLVGEGILSFGLGYLTQWVGQQAIYDLRTKVFRHIQRQSLAFFHQPNWDAEIVVLDLDMPGKDPVEVIRLLADQQHSTRVLVYTGHTRQKIIDRVFDAGASYFHGLLPILAAFSAYKDDTFEMVGGVEQEIAEWRQKHPQT